MPRDAELADRLRAQGLDVVEVAGWQERGSSSFTPRGFVWHHTAGPRAGNAPSLATCIYGRRDLPGPLCNVFLARDGRVYVVAAGRANHAGPGAWAGLSGNSSVWGLEIENVGTAAEPWSPTILDIAARIAVATGAAAELCCQHKEWTRRKVDMHTISGDDMRARVRAIRRAPAPGPDTDEENDEMDEYWRNTTTGAIVRVYGERFRHLSGPQWKARTDLARLAGRPIPLKSMTGPQMTEMIRLLDLIQDPT